MRFLLYFVNVMNYADWFLNVKFTFYSCNEHNFILMY